MDENKGIYKVWKSTQKRNETREVNVTEGKCTCSKWKSTEVPCWHMFSVFKNTNWEYNNLPLHVRNAGHMTFETLDVHNNTDYGFDELDQQYEIPPPCNNNNSNSLNDNTNFSSLQPLIPHTDIKNARNMLSKIRSKMRDIDNLTYALESD
eukprot:248335_1